MPRTVEELLLCWKRGAIDNVNRRFGKPSQVAFGGLFKDKGTKGAL